MTKKSLMNVGAFVMIDPTTDPATRYEPGEAVKGDYTDWVKAQPTIKLLADVEDGEAKGDASAPGQPTPPADGAVAPAATGSVPPPAPLPVDTPADDPKNPSPKAADAPKKS